MASPVEDDDDEDSVEALSFSPSAPQYTLQVKAQVTKSDGVGIGFTCFETEKPDAEHFGGSAFFTLNRPGFEAYYSAIWSSLDYIHKHNKNIKSLTVQCDHDTVVNQLSGKYEIQKDSIRTLYWKVMEAKETWFDDVRFEYIKPRANKEAGELASKALGSKSLMAYHFSMMDPMVEQAAGDSKTQKSTKDSRSKKGADDNATAQENDEEPPEEVAIEEPTTKKDTTTEAVRKNPMMAPKEEDEAYVWDFCDAMDDDVVDEEEAITNTSSHVPSPSISVPNGPSIYPDRTYVLEFDGGSRENPVGDAGSGMVLYDTGPSGNEKHEVWAGWQYLGKGKMTNNQAEYSGLIAGLEVALARGIRKIQCFGDSKLVVKHISGEYRVRNAGLRPFWERTKELLEKFDSYEMHHIYRHLNSRADALANLAMDNQESGSSD